MWWTAITFAAVAAWFEWVYRHDKNRPAAKKDSPKAPPNEVEHTVGPKREMP